MGIEVGQMVKAKQDRIFEFDGYDPFVIWSRGQVLRVQGIFQDSPGGVRELMICLDQDNWDNVPEPIFHELFELVN